MGNSTSNELFDVLRDTFQERELEHDAKEWERLEALLESDKSFLSSISLPSVKINWAAVFNQKTLLITGAILSILFLFFQTDFDSFLNFSSSDALIKVADEKDEQPTPPSEAIVVPVEIDTSVLTTPDSAIAVVDSNAVAKDSLVKEEVVSEYVPESALTESQIKERTERKIKEQAIKRQELIEKLEIAEREQARIQKEKEAAVLAAKKEAAAIQAKQAEIDAARIPKKTELKPTVTVKRKGGAKKKKKKIIEPGDDW